jgi:hypothetical protein
VARGIGGFAIDGEAEGDESGEPVRAAGDVNGDGLADVIVGAPGRFTMEPDRPGRAYVVFGKADTALVPLADVSQGIGGFVMDGEAVGDRAGYAASGAGDVNGDGLSDVVVGAWGVDQNGTNSGRTYVVFGKTDTDPVALAEVAQGIGGFAVDGEAEGDFSGVSVSGAGDTNGDGLADLILGASGATSTGLEQTGRAYVVFGKAGTARVALADVVQGIGGFVMDGEAEGDYAGFRVSRAGDVNGDELVDLVVAATGDDQNGINSGRTYVVLGKTDPENVALADVAQGIGGFAMDGEARANRAGTSVDGAGDINGDGLDDVLVGKREVGMFGEAILPGRTYVVLGKTDTESVQLADLAPGIGGFTLEAEPPWEFCASKVSRAGDLNGDGLADLIAGASVFETAAGFTGRTYVVFGKTNNDQVWLTDVAEGIGGFAMDGEAPGDFAGWSVSGGQDINGDNIPDLIVGADEADPNGLDAAGRTYVVFGGDFSCEGG